MPRDKVFEKMISSAKRAPLWHVMQLRKYKNRKKKTKSESEKETKNRKRGKIADKLPANLPQKVGVTESR